MFRRNRHDPDARQDINDAARWLKLRGKVLATHAVPGPPRAPDGTVLDVLLAPGDGEPFTAVVRLIPGEPAWDNDLYIPANGTITSFLFDPATSQTRVDMTDPRNSITAHLAANRALMTMAGTPPRADAGPPWIVPAQCPYCLAPADQNLAAAQPQPQCTNCAQPLPAYPFVSTEPSDQALS